MDDERIGDGEDMTDNQPDDQPDCQLERAIALLRTHVPVDASAFDARVLASVRVGVRQPVPALMSGTGGIGSEPATAAFRSSLRSSLRSSFRKNSFRTVSWIAAAALAAGIAVAVVIHGSREIRPSAPAVAADAATLNTTTRATQLVRFRFIGADAARVAVAGSFNGWSTSTTPLRRIGDSTWVADVALTAGRHVYQFVINNHRWVPDPTAPRDPAGDFGAANSVVTVVVQGRS